MTRFALLLSLLIATLAHAEQITLKGLSVGMTKEKVLDVVPWLLQACIPLNGLRQGTEGCRYRPTPDRSADDPLNSLGGVPVKSWTVILRDGVIKQIMVSLHPDHFDRLRLAISERYGAPTKQTSSTISNRMGARFDQVESIWRVGESILLLTKRDGQIDQASATLTSDRTLEESERDRTLVRPKADAKDM